MVKPKKKQTNSSSEDESDRGTKLKGTTNHRQWARTIEFKLESKDLWRFVMGEMAEVTRPDPLDLATYPQGEETEGYINDEKRFRLYHKKKTSAARIIWDSCSEDVQASIEDTKDPAVMWSRLNDEYNQKTNGRGQSSTALRDEMASLYYEFGDNIDKFFNRLTRIINQLREADGIILDNEIVAVIFRSMPPELKSFKSAYRATMPAGDDLKYKTVMEDFRTEVLELLRENEKDEAYVVKAKKGGTPKGNRSGARSPGGKRGQSVKHCTICKINGH